VEVGSASSHHTFEEFKAAIRATKLRFDDFDRRLTVEYVTSAGDHMRFTYGGKRLLNTHAVNFRTYRLFDGPYVQAEVGAGVITLRYKGKTRILDVPKGVILDN
jgi:hypothetical protein